MLTSTVTDTSEQRPNRTQCRPTDDFLHRPKTLEWSETLPAACLSEAREQDDRCARKTHTPNQRLSICVPATPQVHSAFGSLSSCFQHALWIEEVQKHVFQYWNTCACFPQMKIVNGGRYVCRSATEVSMSSRWTPLHAGPPSNQSLS